MAIVTLLTDFGTDDAYAGMMKGAILSVNPTATIVDISHHIEPHDLTRAAYTISASYNRFGNLMTDIDAGRLETFSGADAENRLQVLFGGDRLTGLSRNYAQVEPMHPLAIIGSLGYLEIAVNCGSARRHYRAEKGDAVRIVKS
ncbi:MAG: SAM-dependent chlorinase/fluorinase [Pseudomonadota bacterium]